MEPEESPVVNLGWPEVREKLRPQAISLLDAFFVVDGGIRELAAGDKDPCVLMDELEGIRIAGDDEHVCALRPGLTSQCAQHIIGLVLLDSVHRDVKGFDDLIDAPHLADQRIRHLVPIGFVLIIHLVSERAPAVKGHSDIVRPLVLPYPEQHGGEAQDSVGQLTP
jgi:hypothetical protein